MKKYLVVVPGYPSEQNKYNNAFVHSRVKNYLKNNLDVEVFSVEKNKDTDYEYEGVKVCTGNYDKLKEKIKSNKYDKFLVHFGFKKIINSILEVNPDAKLVIWVHGVEALGWYRRLFTFDIKKIHRFCGYILFNTRQLLFLNHFIRNNKNHEFVFVSEWMKNILENDSHTKGKIKKYTIIPNVIDNTIFDYNKKKETDRLNILSIRPYASKKYANDLSVETILKLSQKDYFNKLHFTFYGDGKLFDKTLAPIKDFSNVSINKRFLKQDEISKLHKQNGVMLIPTRQDAQGVSMCEAMSSGLVVITSDNTAIPEYMNNKAGYLCKNVEDMVNAVEDIYNNPKSFLKKSEYASEFINGLCAPEIVIKKELDIIRK